VIAISENTRIRDYVLLTRLCQTNMGQVWKAQDVVRNRVVVLKMLRDDLVTDPEFRERFLDESKRHCNLEHSHIVPVYDYFAEENLLVLVMRYIDGQSLSQALTEQAGKPLPVSRILRISDHVLSALDYAHRNGIVHRDVKPSNILLDREDNANLIDFGISVAIGDIRKTRVGTVIGTPLYMSPEQIRTPREVDQRTDVYSFGCVLFEMATGRAPFVPAPGEDPDFAVRQAHLTQRPVFPKGLVPDPPAALKAIIGMALEKKPDDRIPGCGEFRRLLQEVGATQVPPKRRLWRWAAALFALFAAVWLLTLLLKPSIDDSIAIAPPKPVAGQPVRVRLPVRRASAVQVKPAQTFLVPATQEYVFQDGFRNSTDLDVVASNLFGTVEKKFHIEVVPPAVPLPVIDEWSVLPARIAEGETVRLRWSVRNADEVNLEPLGHVSLRGAQTQTPRTNTTYTLTATNQGGPPVSRTQEVEVAAAPAPPEPTPPNPTPPNPTPPNPAPAPAPVQTFVHMGADSRPMPEALCESAAKNSMAARGLNISGGNPVWGASSDVTMFVYCIGQPGGVYIVIAAASQSSEIAGRFRNDVRTEVFDSPGRRPAVPPRVPRGTGSAGMTFMHMGADSRSMNSAACASASRTSMARHRLSVSGDFPVWGSSPDVTVFVHCLPRPEGVFIIVAAASQSSEVAEKFRNEIRTEVFGAR
jgi:tRNA A-37 threonylcarbamoyl transferase component Bud32